MYRRDFGNNFPVGRDRFYDVLDKYILTSECEDEAIKAKIDEKHQKNLFKLQPIPTFVPSRE